MNQLIPPERIDSKILYIRRQKVMLDRDLAELYDVETRVLIQAVKRNIARFPKDFMFQLNKAEFENWKSQIVISNSIKMGLRKLPYAFTEQGVAMLSSVLNSDRAIQINIQIMRAFTRLRGLLSTYEELKKAILKLAQKHDEDVSMLFTEIDRLDRLLGEHKTQRRIGFRQDDD